MYKFLISFFLLVMVGKGYSQEGNYLYIDSENSQAFYVKMNGKLYSSSQNGYLILSGLKERRYELNIGFPKDAFPEQRFIIPLNNDNQGFHLKNLDNKGWGLLNLKTQELLMNNNPPKQPEDTGQVIKTDAFSVLLSKVVNDPAVLITTPPVKEETVAELPAADRAMADITAITAKPENGVKDTLVAASEPIADKQEVASAIKDSAIVREIASSTKDSAIAKVDRTVLPMPDYASVEDSVVQDIAKDSAGMSTPAVTQEPIRIEKPPVLENPSNVLKLYDQQFEKIYKATYIDKTDGANDTIRISYPINQEIIPQNIPDSEKINSNPSEKLRDFNQDTQQKKTIMDTAATASQSKIILVNTDCKNFADEQDVDKLRVKILDEKNTEEKINAAKKYFKTKCFTVKQIRALSELFTEDENKYRFFDTAYPFISDFENFPILEELLNETYYKNRFKALIRK